MEWAKQFYKEQFLLIEENMEQLPRAYYEEEVKRIQEQFGKPFNSVLELGAGDGHLANVLASHAKDVTTIEFVEERVEFAKKHATAPVTILWGDFYTINVEQKFDCVLYIDGFGVGEDADQLRLLQRIYEWLSEDGYALIDIYEPNYWRNVYKGELLPSKSELVIRQYDFEENTNRFIDTWWKKGAVSEKYSQSLKCYSPIQIYELCQQANLDIVGYFPGGAMDYGNWTYNESAALEHCISYRIKLKRK